MRVDQLWLTSLERKGDSLQIAGEAGSVNAVANFITQLKRSGYFDKIEIQEAKEDDVVKSVTTYGFTMSAAIAPFRALSATPIQARLRRCSSCAARAQGEELAMPTSL